MTTVVHSHPIWLPQTQTWLYNQVRNLPPDFECHVVCERTENLEQFNLPNIHALRDRSALRYYGEKALIRARLRKPWSWLADNIRTTGAVLVHSHFGHIAWHDMLACRETGVPQVVTFYGLDVNLLPATQPEWRERYIELFASAARVLCEGPHMAACVRELGCSEDKLIVHHLGVAFEDLPFQPRSFRPTEPLRVLIAASFREKKGIPYAIEALARIARQIAIDITIIGDSDGTPASNAEKRLILGTIDKFGLSNLTRLLGYQSHSTLISEALAHHVFLSPSVTALNGDTEGGAPVSIIEMAATGMPVIATRHCDIPEVVLDGETGYLADERDSEGLAACLERLIAQPHQWGEMAAAARRHVESSFDCQNQGARLGDIYRRVIGEC